MSDINLNILIREDEPVGTQGVDITVPGHIGPQTHRVVGTAGRGQIGSCTQRCASDIKHIRKAYKKRAMAD